MASISLDFLRSAFHHLWTRILGFRRFYQGKYDIDISDLCACRNNTRVGSAHDFCDDVCKWAHPLLDTAHQFHCSRRTWNVTSVLLHDKRFGLNKDVQSYICNRNRIAPISFRCLKLPLKVREALQEARSMLANRIIKASAISLPGTKGCARILFVTQRGKL